MLDEMQANKLCEDYQQKYRLVCVDPIRHGVNQLIEKLTE